MKSLIIGFILCTGLAHAETLNLTVKNFNFTYSDPNGEGSAASFSRSNLLNGPVNVSVDKVDTLFKLSVSGAENQEYELKDAPAFMTEAETMVVTGFNLNFLDKLDLSLKSGNFSSKESNLKLDGLSLDCAKDASLSEIMDQIFSGCIQKMSFKSSKFSSESLEAAFINAISIDDGEVKVSSLDFKSAAGKYNLSAEIKAQVSGKIKSYGTMSYDAANSLVTLKISEVKFGIFNITSKVFDELKKKESEKLKVKQPYVYYKLK